MSALTHVVRRSWCGCQGERDRHSAPDRGWGRPAAVGCPHGAHGHDPRLRRPAAAGHRRLRRAPLPPSPPGSAPHWSCRAAPRPTLIVTSFAGRALLATTAGLPLCWVRDVGTAVVAVLMSFRLPWLPPLFLIAGVALFMTTGDERARHLGRVGIGLGLMLLALQLLVAVDGPAARRARAAAGSGRPRRGAAGGHAGGGSLDLARAFEPRGRAAAVLARGQPPAGAADWPWRWCWAPISAAASWPS